MPGVLVVLQLRNPGTSDKEPPKTFTFDQVYDWNSRQDTIFDITAKPIIDACMDGYNGTACTTTGAGTWQWPGCSCRTA